MDWWWIYRRSKPLDTQDVDALFLVSLYNLIYIAYSYPTGLIHVTTPFTFGANVVQRQPVHQPGLC
uniref:hypothetical protein n=1 Tax=Escherichia coli TaxID=562 RepID=UPI00195499C0